MRVRERFFMLESILRETDIDCQDLFVIPHFLIHSVPRKEGILHRAFCNLPPRHFSFELFCLKRKAKQMLPLFSF